jgi:hypothetical protein
MLISEKLNIFCNPTPVIENPASVEALFCFRLRKVYNFLSSVVITTGKRGNFNCSSIRPIVLKCGRGRICGPLMLMRCDAACIRICICIFNNAYYFLKYLSY